MSTLPAEELVLLLVYLGTSEEGRQQSCSRNPHHVAKLFRAVREELSLLPDRRSVNVEFEREVAKRI